MSFTDEETKRAADMKEWLEGQIVELEAQLARMTEALLVVDSILKRTSFRKATELQPAPEAEVQTMIPKPAAPQVSEVRQIRRVKTGPLVANAYITSASVSIVPASDVQLNTSTSPFKSFFVNRILEGMRQKDLDQVGKGQLAPETVLEYSFDEKAGMIQKIVINNYRERQRLDEIINTATWAFARMMEKAR